MAVALGFEYLTQLCKALGLEGRMVRRVVIDINVNDAVKVYVEEYVKQDQLQELINSLDRDGCMPPIVEVDRIGSVGPVTMLENCGNHETDEPMIREGT